MSDFYGTPGDDTAENTTGGGDMMQGGAGNDTLSGGDGADVLHGGDPDFLIADDDILNGGDGNDFLIGGRGADALNGGAGDDTLAGGNALFNTRGGGAFFLAAPGDGFDAMDGGAGMDRVNLSFIFTPSDAMVVDISDPAAVAILTIGGTPPGPDATTGDDTFTGDAANETADGLEGNDALNGANGDDTLNGGSGDDVIAGGTGADALSGGAGFDTLSYATSPTAVTVDFVMQTISGGDAEGDAVSGFERFIGSAFDDTFFGDRIVNEVFVGGAGADVLVGDLFFGVGHDTVDYSASPAGVNVNDLDMVGFGGDAQGDRFFGIENFIGSAFDDFLGGESSANVLTGGGGDDVLRGREGADTLDGGAGVDIADYSVSSSGNPAVVNLTLGLTAGDAAGDVLIAIEGVFGSVASDTLTGDAAGNPLSGRGGDDVIAGLAGADTLDGGLGLDTVDYSTSIAPVTVDLAAQTASGGHASGDTLAGFERAMGSIFNDALSGDLGANVLNGGAGDDVIAGLADADVLSGGTGVDTVSYAASGTGVAVNLSTNSASGGDAAGDTLSGFERIVGSAFNDTLTGDASANVLTGGAGDDAISGLAGADRLEGSAGDDRFMLGVATDGLDQIYGGAQSGDSGFDTLDYATAAAGAVVQLAGWSTTSGGALLATFFGIESAVGSNFNDALIGDAANNRLHGGSGADWLVGGDGNDTFVQLIDTVNIDRIFGGTASADVGVDTIDFAQAAAGVTIQLSGRSPALKTQSARPSRTCSSATLRTTASPAAQAPTGSSGEPATTRSCKASKAASTACSATRGSTRSIIPARPEASSCNCPVIRQRREAPCSRPSPESKRPSARISTMR